MSSPPTTRLTWLAEVYEPRTWLPPHFSGQALHGLRFLLHNGLHTSFPNLLPLSTALSSSPAYNRPKNSPSSCVSCGPNPRPSSPSFALWHGSDFFHNSSPSKPSSDSDLLTYDEITASKFLLYRLSQLEHYSDIFTSISNSSLLPRVTISTGFRCLSPSMATSWSAAAFEILTLPLLHCNLPSFILSPSSPSCC